MSITSSMIVGQPVDAGTDPSSNSRILGALCYLLLPVVSIIVLVSDSLKSDRFLRFHAVQSIGFAVAVAVYFVVAMIVYFVGTIVTLGLCGCVLWILFIVPVAPWLYYSYLASQDKYFEIPRLTEYMVGQKWLTRPYATEAAAPPDVPPPSPEAPVDTGETTPPAPSAPVEVPEPPLPGDAQAPDLAPDEP
jgi:uncharacterized membrane protein